MQYPYVILKVLIAFLTTFTLANPMNSRIEKYNQKSFTPLLDIWQRSVEATHHFLKKDDIAFYRSLLETIDVSNITIYCAVNEDETILGFIGTVDSKIEMLFVDAPYIGKGIGKALIRFALDHCHVSGVEVNKDNTSAIRFYLGFGFTVVDEKPFDDYGKPYPVLTLQRI